MLLAAAPPVEAALSDHCTYPASVDTFIERAYGYLVKSDDWNEVQCALQEIEDDLDANYGGANLWTDGTGFSYHTDTSDDVVIGSNVTATADIWLKSDGGAVFNETQNSVDFRVESNTNGNAIFVDGSQDKVGIGTGAPGTLLDVNGVLTTVDLIATGDISVPGGNEGTPTVFITGDVNTGMYSPGTNMIALTANGNRHIVADGHSTTGFVGIYPGVDTDDGSWTIGVDGVITKRIEGTKTTSVYLGDYTYVNTTGTVAAGYGTVERIFIENAAGANEIGYQVNYTWTDVTADNEDLDTRWYSMQDGEEEWYMHRAGSTGAVSIADYAPANNARGAVLRLFSYLETDYDSTANVDSGFGGYIEFVSSDDDDVTTSTAFIRWDYDDATAGAEDVDMSFEVYEEGTSETFFSFLGDAVQGDVDESAVDIESPAITGFKPGVVYQSYGWLTDDDEDVNLVPVVPANHIVIGVSAHVVTAFDNCANLADIGKAVTDNYLVDNALSMSAAGSETMCGLNNACSQGTIGAQWGLLETSSIQYDAEVACSGSPTVGAAFVSIQWILTGAAP